MKSPVPKIDLQRVKEEIRAEADALRERAPPMPAVRPRPVSNVGRAYDTDSTEYSIPNLCQFHFTTFLDYAYRALLKRPPDAAGFDGHLKLLVSGGSKIEILGNLRYSGEGRAAAVRVPGLLPRYALAKLYRLPVIGYVFESISGLASLPSILRHQRASDTFHVARSYEIDTARRKTASEFDDLLSDNVTLRKELGNVVERISALRASLERIATVQASEARVDVVRIAAESGELRQLVLSMNHWLASLRQNLGALEHTESDERRRADTLHADIAERILQSDAQRPARLSVFVDTLARALQPSAQVLDLESGNDWLALLTGRGFNAVGADSNHACADRGRAAGLSINAAVPSTVLSRTADESLDGLTALACTALLRDLPVPVLLTQAQRVLRPGGALMFAFGVSASSIADRLCGRSEHRLDESLLSHALAASGFSDLETIVTADGAACVIARKPHTASAQ